jgi:trehalose 6-phosphate phosphatase
LKFAREADLTQWARDAGRLWLLLDYDGTLADFAPTPAHIEPDPRVTGLLERLSKDARKRLAIISGRKLADVTALVPVAGLFLAGTYGLELQSPTGEIQHRADYRVVRPVVEKAKSHWESLVAGRPGFFLEDKGWALALHARFADEAEAAQVLALARQRALTDLPAETFQLLAGHRFLEVAPAVAQKGETVGYLLQEHPWPGSQMVYIGDDDKDEAAFRMIHMHGGVAIWVTGASRRPRPTAADYTLESPAAVRHWLESISR